VINAMGLNNDGAEAIAEKLRGLKEKQARTEGRRKRVGKKACK